MARKKAAIATLIMPIVLVLGSCATIQAPAETAPAEESAPPVEATSEAAQTSTTEGVPAPPVVPREVLSMWNSPPPSIDTMADVEGKITLQPNPGSETALSEDIEFSVIPKGTWQDSTPFHLKEGQWVDVIVTSLDIPIYFNWDEPGAISLNPACWFEYEGKKVRSGYYQKAQVVGETPSREMSVFDPLYGKLLYENVVTSTEKGTIFTTAARIFTWSGATEYWLVFYNWSPEKSANVTYRVCLLETTHGWGDEFKDEELQPWLNELYRLRVVGSITQEEYDVAEGRWLEQFK